MGNINSGVLRPLGSTGLRCSPLGFGCYRVADGVVEHKASLTKFLELGGNLVDTSTNYADGQSELLVGKTLKEFSDSNVIVVTKAGYIQGQNMALAKRSSFSEVVEYGEGIWHCIHPDFLETQLTASCERLQREYLDVFLLHNPEYFLSHQAHNHVPNSEDQEEFYRRISQAFIYLENQVKKGRIKWYGISSNNYGLPVTDPVMSSVERCLTEAESISPDHHFRVIQFPLNLYETGGVLETNNSGASAVEFSHQKGLGVLINRPLNAFHLNQMIRLADFSQPGQAIPGPEEIDRLLIPLQKAECSLVDQLEAPLLTGPSSGFVDLIKQIVPQVRSADQWDWVIERYLIPPLKQWLEASRRKFEGDEFWEQWQKLFLQEFQEVLERLQGYLFLKQQDMSNNVRVSLEKIGYQRNQASLSQIALSLLINIDGISCVLNGMRKPAYVRDALGAIDIHRADSLSILKMFSQQS